MKDIELQIIIPDNCDVQDFAVLVAEFLKEEYGRHNFEVFLEQLNKELNF